jgi:hypothetical protein
VALNQLLEKNTTVQNTIFDSDESSVAAKDSEESKSEKKLPLKKKYTS